MAQRLLNPFVGRGIYAMAAGLAPGSPPGVKLKHEHARKGDHRERPFDCFRSVGNACRSGGNDRGQPALLRVLATQKRPSMNAALCPATLTSHEIFHRCAAID